MKFIIHVSAIVEYNGLIALVQEGRPDCRGKWNLPGGLLKTGEGLIQGTQRKIREELGQSLSLNGFLGIYTGIGENHCLNFVFTAKAENSRFQILKKRQIINQKWFNILSIYEVDELNFLNPHKLKRILRDYRNRDPYTIDCIGEKLFRFIPM